MAATLQPQMTQHNLRLQDSVPTQRHMQPSTSAYDSQADAQQHIQHPAHRVWLLFMSCFVFPSNPQAPNTPGRRAQGQQNFTSKARTSKLTLSSQSRDSLCTAAKAGRYSAVSSGAGSSLMNLFSSPDTSFWWTSSQRKRPV